MCRFWSPNIDHYPLSLSNHRLKRSSRSINRVATALFQFNKTFGTIVSGCASQELSLKVFCYVHTHTHTHKHSKIVNRFKWQLNVVWKAWQTMCDVFGGSRSVIIHLLFTRIYDIHTGVKCCQFVIVFVFFLFFFCSSRANLKSNKWIPPGWLGNRSHKSGGHWLAVFFPII